MVQRMLFVIKPEGMVCREGILSLVRMANLAICRRAIIRLSSYHLSIIYQELPQDLVLATEYFMGRESAEIVEIAGDNAVNRMLAVSGYETDPLKCLPTTIRARFGKPGVRFGSIIYFRNAIHRPKSQWEADRDWALLSHLL